MPGCEPVHLGDLDHGDGGDGRGCGRGGGYLATEDVYSKAAAAACQPPFTANTVQPRTQIHLYTLSYHPSKIQDTGIQIREEIHQIQENKHIMIHWGT